MEGGLAVPSAARRVGNWENIQRHLGRKREFWVWLIDGWRNLPGGAAPIAIDAFRKKLVLELRTIAHAAPK